jgi:prevent-host-death family protein
MTARATATATTVKEADAANRDLTFRNSRGEITDIPVLPATQLKNLLGRVLEQVTRDGAVAITRHDAPKAVLLSFEEFKALTRERAPALHELQGEYDELLARMQTRDARAGMAAAFGATPAQLGKAARNAARKSARVKRAQAR